MRLGMGHLIMLAGIVLIAGPFVAPFLYDAAAVPLTVSFGADLILFGALFRKILPLVGGGRRGPEA